MKACGTRSTNGIANERFVIKFVRQKPRRNRSTNDSGPAVRRKLRINVEQSNFGDGKTNSVARDANVRKYRVRRATYAVTQPFPIKFIAGTEAVPENRRLPPVTKFGAS